jgi:hypothetical protein
MSAITLFEEKQVRRAWNAAEEKWYFSVDDVVGILTGSVNVKDYIKKLRKRDPELDGYWGTNCPLVEMTAADGKQRMTFSGKPAGAAATRQTTRSALRLAEGNLRPSLDALLARLFSQKPATVTDRRYSFQLPKHPQP